MSKSLRFWNELNDAGIFLVNRLSESGSFSKKYVRKLRSLENLLEERTGIEPRMPSFLEMSKNLKFQKNLKDAGIFPVKRLSENKSFSRFGKYVRKVMSLENLFEERSSSKRHYSGAIYPTVPTTCEVVMWVFSTGTSLANPKSAIRGSMSSSRRMLAALYTSPHPPLPIISNDAKPSSFSKKARSSAFLIKGLKMAGPDPFPFPLIRIKTTFTNIENTDPETPPATPPARNPSNQAANFLAVLRCLCGAAEGEGA
ncbi:hypothetical protein Cgig2_004438 [Carnegiea gigantea]|uniref:Uncharacterized protein n=1 Tax=Carnegiea gigantea TaxID=171969 RepID=A0A9Q1JUX9_9CARY|nr:hypothetical protein Cgig2_004438 [Carnegiea gigantea]